MQHLALYSDHVRSAMSEGLTNGGGNRFLADLAAVGLLRPQGQGFAWVEGDGAADLRLLRLIERFDLTVMLIPVAGAVLALAIAPMRVGAGEERATFTGKGFAPADAVRRCLGELAEFTSWVYDPARDRARLQDAPPGPGLRTGAELLDLAGDAYVERTAASLAGWCAFERLGGDAAAVRLPAALAFGRYAGPDAALPGAGLDSSGCAAGRTMAEASRRGLLEVIERDATGLWWHRALARPEAPEAHITARLGPALAGHTAETGRACRFLDLTTDLGVPVAAAISTEPDGTLPALGVACRPQMAAAMEGAYLEMVQSELAIAALMQRADAPGPRLSDEDRELIAWYDRVDLSTAPWLVPQDVRPPEHAQISDGDDTLATCLSRLEAAGLAAFAFDLTRAELGIPATRIVVPGAAHFRRRQGMARLTTRPALMGWDSMLPGSGFNPLPLLI